MATNSDLVKLLSWAIGFAKTEHELRDWASKECNLHAIGMLDDDMKNQVRSEWAKRRDELRENRHEKRRLAQGI